MNLLRIAIVLLFALSPVLAHAKGERELVMVLAAKARSAIAARGEPTDAPPNVRINNLQKSAGEAAIRAAEAANHVSGTLGGLLSTFKARPPKPEPTVQLEKTDPPTSQAVVLPPSLQITVPVSAAGQQEVFRIVVLTQDGCHPCDLLDREIGKGYELDGARVIADWVNVVTEPSRVPRAYQGALIQTPLITFRTIDDAPLQFRWPTNKRDIIQRLRYYKASQERPVAATGAVGGLSGVRQSIVDGLDLFNARVNGPLTCTWDSNRNNGTGAKDGFALFNAKASDWKFDRLYGTLGSFSVRCPGGIKIGDELFEQLDINYRSIGGRVEITTSFAVEKSMLAPGDRTSAVAAASGPVKVVDPGTAMAIFSLLRGIWELSHPEVDLQLPGRISATVTVQDGAFVVKFDGAPRVRIKVLWEWMLGIDQAIVSPTNAHFDFMPQGYLFEIKSRNFPINN